MNFTRSWAFGFFRVYWASKSNCIILDNLRAEGLREKVLNVVICIESGVQWWDWPSREIETVGNSRKQSETVGNSWKQSETVGNSRKQSETVGNSRKQSGAARHDQAKIVNPNCFLHKKKKSGQSPFFLESSTGNSWKQLGLELSRKKGDCPDFFSYVKNNADWQFWPDHAWPLPTVSDCFRLFPTVSISLEGQSHHWTPDSIQIIDIQHFFSQPFCAQVVQNDAIWLWTPIYPKKSKSPRPREIQ